GKGLYGGSRCGDDGTGTEKLCGYYDGKDWDRRILPAGHTHLSNGRIVIMVLKGVMTIELTDENTGAVETVTEENMVTEAVNNMLGPSPMVIFYAATGEYGAAVVWNDNLLPICPNVIGGILLFAKALEADAGHI